MRRFAAVLFVLVLGGCGTTMEVAIPVTTRSDAGQGCVTAGGAPIKVLFVAKEAVLDELDGVRYFVQDWGKRQGCFDGTVVTTARTADLARVAVAVVDISHDAQLSADDAQALQAFIDSGKRVAVFGWPLRLSDRSVIPAPLSGLENSLGGVRFTVARACGDWEYAQAPTTPFNLGHSYRYENFGSAIFTVNADAPQRHWANSLFCPTDPGATMIELTAGVVAGFSFGYSVSLADNNIRATGMKRLVVDTIRALASPANLS
mgnify:CR=1 FL=1